MRKILKISHRTYYCYEESEASRRFEELEHLKVELMAYVYWFNNKRIHGSLGYKSLVEFRQALL
jgi:transposase InsO family protein